MGSERSHTKCHQLPLECLSSRSSLLLAGLEVIPPERNQVPPAGSLAEDHSQGQLLPSLLPAPGMASLIQFPQETLGQRNAVAVDGVHRHEEGDSGAPPQTSLPRQEGGRALTHC